MKPIVMLILCASALPSAQIAKPQAGSLTTYFNQVVPLVIVGEGWSQRLVLTNVDTSHPAIGTIQFYTQSGAPWTVNTVSSGRNSAFLFNLQPGQTFMLDTAVSQAPQSLGWAFITETTAGLGDLFGQLVFRKQTAGLPDFMCSLVLGSQAFARLSVFFDNTNGNSTGMGIITSQICNFSCDTADSLRVTVQDLSGNTISQKTITQKKGTLYWMNLAADFPATAGKMGMFVVEPVTKYSTTLTGFSLQFAGNGAFTAITPFEN